MVNKDVRRILSLRMTYLGISGIYTALCQSLLGCAVSSMLKYYKKNFDPNINKAWVKEIHACCGLFIGVSAPLFSLIFVFRSRERNKNNNNNNSNNNKVYYTYIIVQLLYFVVGTMPAYLYRNIYGVLALRCLFGVVVGFSEAFTIYEISDLLADKKTIEMSNLKISQPLMFAIRSSCMSLMSLICNSSGGKLIEIATKSGKNTEGVFNIFWMYTIPPVIILPMYIIWLCFNKGAVKKFDSSSIINASITDQEKTRLLNIEKGNDGNSSDENLQTQVELKTETNEKEETEKQNVNSKINEPQSHENHNRTYYNFAYEAVAVIGSAFIIQMVFYIVPTSVSIIVADLNIPNESTKSGLASGMCQCFSAIGSISYGLIMWSLKLENKKKCCTAASIAVNVQKNKNKVSQTILIHDLIMVVCCILLVGGLILFSYANTYTLVVISVSICGLVSGPCMPNYNATGSLITYVSASGAKNRALISGFLIFSTFVSHTLTPLVFGDLMNLKEYKEVFVGALVLLIYIVVFIVTKITYDQITWKKQEKENYRLI